jgi:hypothetical protein
LGKCLNKQYAEPDPLTTLFLKGFWGAGQ